LAVHLETVGLTSGWACFRGYLPDNPDRAFVIIETTGVVEETTFRMDYPRFQIRVRGAAFDDSAIQAHAQALFDELHTQTTIQGSGAAGADIVAVIGLNPPVLTDRDDRDRAIFSFNSRVLRATQS